VTINTTPARWLEALLTRRALASAFVVAALFEVTGCGYSNPVGTWQLPVPPTHEQPAFTAAAPQNGPPLAPMNECKQGPGYGGPGYGGNVVPGAEGYRVGWGNYRLGTGDKIRVVVLQDTEFSGDYEVDPTGSVSARMLGPVKVAGKTTAEVEEMLRESYRSSGYLVAPRISVELVAARPFYIVGEVSRNGSFPYVACLHVIQAIAIAGGFTRRAARGRLTIRRFYPTTAEEEYVNEDTLVEPGDVIRVPERYF
jgi:polysaccharide export outer membrane protein